MELLEEQRENWGTRGGFVLAAVGSAVGLGNLWGFPYKLYSYGGGAFLVPYIVAMICIGIPMLILEFSLGHFTQHPGGYGGGREEVKRARQTPNTRSAVSTGRHAVRRENNETQ